MLKKKKSPKQKHCLHLSIRNNRLWTIFISPDFLNRKLKKSSSSSPTVLRDACKFVWQIVCMLSAPCQPLTQNLASNTETTSDVWCLSDFVVEESFFLPPFPACPLTLGPWTVSAYGVTSSQAGPRTLFGSPTFIFPIAKTSVVYSLPRPYGLQPARLLCPWDLPGKNTEVGCHFLLQEIFLTQGLNPCLWHCRWILYHRSSWEALYSFISLFPSLTFSITY